VFRIERKREGEGARLGSTPRSITRHCLDSALACARSSHPNEFGGILRADPPGTISELLLLPGTTAGRRHANFQLNMMPIDLGVSGTVHSHPSGALHPSDADVRLFRHWGKAHVILGAPYTGGMWRAYNGNGLEMHLKVVGLVTPEAETSPRLRTYRPRTVHREGGSAPGSGDGPDDEE
jgi:proteasome lid subunit RPN8/RPN11